MSEAVKHEMTPDGESTAQWAIVADPGFLGSVRQLVDCARCGNGLPFRRKDEPRRFRDIFKPTMHILCDPCWEELPHDR